MGKQQKAAHLLVNCLEKHGVKFIFGLPGAKINGVFDALLDSSIKVILCRHEQNAAFMAAAASRRSAASMSRALCSRETAVKS